MHLPVELTICEPICLLLKPTYDTNRDERRKPLVSLSHLYPHDPALLPVVCDADPQGNVGSQSKITLYIIWNHFNFSHVLGSFLCITKKTGFNCSIIKTVHAIKGTFRLFSRMECIVYINYMCTAHKRSLCSKNR